MWAQQNVTQLTPGTLRFTKAHMKSYQIMLDFKRPDGLNATLTNQVVRLPKFGSTFSPKNYLYSIQQQKRQFNSGKSSMKFLDVFGGFVPLPKPRGGSWLPPGRRSLTSPMTFTSQTARVGSTRGESWSWPQNMPFLELAVRKSGDEGVGIICGGGCTEPEC